MTHPGATERGAHVGRSPADGSATHPRTGLPARLAVLPASASATTGLAAFHRCLVALGLGRYNLVRLSSVVPPGVEVVPGAPAGLGPGRHGDRLYCVYAEAFSEVPDAQVWAGVGWALRADGDGGYLVEHHGSTAGDVEAAIRASLAEIVADEGVDFRDPQWVLEGAVCDGRPTCEIVVVPYAVLPW